VEGRPDADRLIGNAALGALPVLLLGAFQVVRAYMPLADSSEPLLFIAAALFTTGAIVGLAKKAPTWSYTWIAFSISALSRLPAPYLRQAADTSQDFAVANIAIALVSLAVMGTVAYLLSGRGKAHGFLIVTLFIMHPALSCAVAGMPSEPQIPNTGWMLLYGGMCALTAWTAYQALALLNMGDEEAGPAALRVLVTVLAAAVFTGTFPVNYFGLDLGVMWGSVLRPAAQLLTGGILIAIASLRWRRDSEGGRAVAG
jgi:hypothetical protein